MPKLYDLAHCRAGDKGNTSILSLIAYRAADYPLLAAGNALTWLTSATVPVVMFSAVYSSRAGDLGGAAFLKKPLDFDQLLELVRRFCASTG